MPLPTRTEVRQHNAFLRRQERYERTYYPRFYSYLNLVYDTAATTIEKVGVDGYFQQLESKLHHVELRNIYLALYREFTLDEAKIEWQMLNGPVKNWGHVILTKDLIDDLAGSFPFREGGVIRVWRDLLNDYLNIRIATRVTQVNQATVKFITKIIEKGISDGLGALQIAKLLRKERQFNANRALAIARTETVTASNQGKYMAALSSDLTLVKRWIPANDARTRDSHLLMLNSDFIDLEQPFILTRRKGGTETARYPGDESLSAENTVNCRCSIGFKAKRDAQGNPIRRL